MTSVLPGLGFGAVIGLALGSLGAGGSILTVPILVYALGLPVQAATGTSLAIVGLTAALVPRLTSAAAWRSHARGPRLASRASPAPSRVPG